MVLQNGELVRFMGMVVVPPPPHIADMVRASESGKPYIFFPTFTFHHT